MNKNKIKLIDILAREMDCWPEVAWTSVGQSCKGELHGEPFTGRHIDLGLPVADDCFTAVVTREEWEAAREALNPAWTGAGLPPVGTVCEVQHESWDESIWEARTIAYLGEHSVTIEADGHEVVGKAENLRFRPIHTAEQIAADERKRQILEMIDSFGQDTAIWGRDAVMEICGNLWEFGYRKVQP